MSQGARICPHCKRRVDERRAKGLAYCLSCGQPLAGFAATSAPPSLRPNSPSQFGGPPSQYGGAPQSQYGGAPPPSQYGAPVSPQYGTPPPGSMGAYPIQPQNQQQKGSGAVGLIIGVVIGLGGLLAIVIAVIIVVVGRSSSSSSSSTTASNDTPTSTVAIETPPTATTTDDTKTTPTANATHHAKPPPSASVEIPTTGPQVFPFARAFEKMDEATTSAERLCPRAEGPFGTTVVDITFEVDGRTGTTSHLPIGGTAEGSCITAQFLAIKLGAFEGTKRTFSRSVTMRAPSGSTATTATASGRTNKPDAGH